MDTGSDYDAIDEDLAALQSEQGNPAFQGRRQKVAETVRGFKVEMETSTSVASTWEVLLVGNARGGGSPKETRLILELNEFSGLSDPLILGMPMMENYGGLDFNKKEVWVAGLWLPRYRRPQSLPSQVSSLSICDASSG